MSTELYITIPVATLSCIITLLLFIILIFLLLRFVGTAKENENNDEFNSNVILNYFKYSAVIAVIFGLLNSSFTTIYCLYLVFDPYYDDNMFYINHSSHYQRISATVCWYTSKVALIWFFNGRLYYAFIGSLFTVKRIFFISINVIITIMAPCTLLCAYLAVYAQNLLFAEIAFNSFRIIYEILTFILLYMFSQRLLFLTIKEQSLSIILENEARDNNTMSCVIHSFDGINDPEKINDDDMSMPTVVGRYSALQKTTMHGKRMSFMEITTRNAVLVLTISISVALVIFAFTSFRFIFLPQTRLTLLIPMVTASMDSLITSICIVCLFQIGDKMYPLLCKFCHDTCFKRICVYFAERSLHTIDTDI